MITIDLNEYGGKNYKVLSGVPLGREMRKHYKLNELDKKQDEVITFKIPDSVYSVNSSFFAGLFQASIKTLGESHFREKYLFDCNDIIRKNIEDGIFYATNTMDLLGGN